MTEIQEAYRDDTTGRHYHPAIVTKKSPIRMEKSEPPVTVNLNEPISRDEFKQLSNETKATYIKYLRAKFEATSAQIAEMLGYDKQYFSRICRELKLKGLFPKGGNMKSKRNATAWNKFIKKGDENMPCVSEKSTPVSFSTEITKEKDSKKPEVSQINFCSCSFSLKGILTDYDVTNKIKAIVPDKTPCHIEINIHTLEE